MAGKKSTKRARGRKGGAGKNAPRLPSERIAQRARAVIDARLPLEAPGWVEREPGAPHRLLALLSANLDSDADAQRARAALGLVHQGWSVPSIKYLRLLQRVARVLDAMLDAQDADAESWRQLARCLDSAEADKRAAVAVVEDLRQRVVTARKAVERSQVGSEMRAALERAATRSIEQNVRRTIAQLAKLDPRFATVPEATLRQLVDPPRIGSISIAAKLSILSGALGVSLSKIEREHPKQAAREKRVRGAFDQAMRKADGLVKPKKRRTQ